MNNETFSTLHNSALSLWEPATSKKKLDTGKEAIDCRINPIHLPFTRNMLCTVILNEALFPTLCEISIILIQVAIR